MNENDVRGDARSERYLRQIRFPGIGNEGQAKIQQGRVLLCGCGALGSVIANTLVRAGVGFLRLVDRDFLEMSNLQRQVIYDEQDVRSGLPKSIAAADKLRSINSNVEVEPLVADVDAGNIVSMVEDIDLILDGTDNFETRFLLNDVSVKHGIPWVFGGCLGADGQTMTILPGQTACLHCLMPAGPPPAGSMPTCDSGGILGTIINVIASIQSNEALKILSGNTDRISRALTVCELWDNGLRQLQLDDLRDSIDCPTCKQRRFEWLEGERTSKPAVLCGRNAVQINPVHVDSRSMPVTNEAGIDLRRLADKLSADGKVESNRFLLRFAIDDYELTVFPDGRAIIKGTEDIATAKSIYARWIGN